MNAEPSHPGRAPGPRRSYDVVVVGGGAVGLAVARELAGRGRRVAVLERDPRGALASRAAAGMLSPRAEAQGPGEFFDLALAGRERFAAFAPQLEAESGLRVDWRRDGLLELALDADEEGEIASRAEWQRAAGLPLEELTRAEVVARWPGLALPAPPARGESPRFGEGRLFFFPDEAQVDNGRLVDALAAACRSHGADLFAGVEALGFRLEGDRVTAVRTPGTELACAVAVNAAGAWAGRVAGWAGEELPVEPVRGQMLSYRTSQSPPRPILLAAGAYCLLREAGELVVGATVERAGWDSAVTPEGQAWLEAAAATLARDLAGAAPGSRWAGLRPVTPDERPVIGFSTEVRGLYHAAGHYRNGILLAPITAELACAELDGDPRAAAATAPFGPGRFSARPAEVP